MENIDERVNMLATDMTILASEIKELDEFISLCDDPLIKNEYMVYRGSLVERAKTITGDMRDVLAQYFDSKPDPVKLHYKILYKKITGQ